MNYIVNGLEFSKRIEEDLKINIKGCIIRPSLALIEVGNNSINEFQYKALDEACNRVGIYLRYYKFDDDTPELTIINKIKELNNDDYVNGILVQLPLPEKYNEKRIINAIINSKDVNGLTDINIGRLISGRKTITSCISLAIMNLLSENNIELEGKEVVIIDKGKLISCPISNLIMNNGATVTICHSKTKDVKKHTLDADIIISAIGIKDSITGNMIKKDSIVIDAGYYIEDGVIKGDVEYKSVSKVSSLILTSTEDIFPMMISMILKNTLLCYNNKNK